MDDFGLLVGATILDVVGCEADSEEVVIRTDRGVMRLYHDQDCCESVLVEDVTGDPADLVGGVVTLAEERGGDPPERGEPDESSTWTFYEIRTTRGDITIRWLGTSNGYYSEDVSVEWRPMDAT